MGEYLTAGDVSNFAQTLVGSGISPFITRPSKHKSMTAKGSLFTNGCQSWRKCLYRCSLNPG
ncbi:Uncharacterised protein [Vibrio cholerae]|nr:Uncharacterised protein [Vibrio cholerae]